MLVVVLVAFAGCAGKSSSSSNGGSSDAAGASASDGLAGASGSGGSGASGSGGSGATGGPSSGGGPIFKGNGTNHAPVVNVFTVNKTTGLFPLKVQFKMNATDQDKDALTFKLNFADGTTELTGTLPSANLTHTFTAKGNYTVKFTASDGKASVNKTLKITVTAPVSGTPTVIHDWTLTWQLGAPGCALVATAEGDSAYGAARNVLPEASGKTYTATFGADPPGNVGNEFFFTAGGTRGSAISATGGAAKTGTVPPGTTLVAFRNCGVLGQTVHFTVIG